MSIQEKREHKLFEGNETQYKNKTPQKAETNAHYIPGD